MKKLKNKLFYVYSALLYMLLASVVFFATSNLLGNDVKSYLISHYSAWAPGTNNNSIIVVVDQSTGVELGKWTREYTTELLDYFDRFTNIKAVVLDSLNNNIDPHLETNKKFLNKIDQMNNLVLGFVPSEMRYVSKDKTEQKQELKQVTEFMDKFADKAALNVIKNEVQIPDNKSVILDITPEYLNAAKNFASVVIQGDKNSSKTFYSSNIIKVKDKYYPSLPFKTYLVENGTNEVILTKNAIVVPKTKLKIPIDKIEDGKIQTNINYYRLPVYEGATDKTAFSHFNIPACQIINIYRKLKAGKILNKEEQQIHNLFDHTQTVFIGEYRNGPQIEESDILLSPLSNRHPGVDIQATTFSNLENKFFLHEANTWTKIIITSIIAIITFLCIFKFSFIRALICTISLDILFFITCTLFASWGGYLIDFITPIVVQLVTLIFGFSFKFITENRNKEKIKQAMGKYLSQDIMKNVVSNIDDLKLGGKRAIVTVLFSDIRGFTSLSEKMTAEEVSLILNEYFAEMEPIITKYNGVINKFIGDAVMAIFGEPIQDINHPQNAVKCAYEMLKKVEYLREKWIFEGKPKIEIGVGINTGEVFIGNIGTETRMEYTVIGDTVNLASRIESYNKVYKTNLLVSSSTYSHIADIADVIKISEVQIRGKAKKMNIYEVLRIDKNR